MAKNGIKKLCRKTSIIILYISTSVYHSYRFSLISELYIHYITHTQQTYTVRETLTPDPTRPTCDDVLDGSILALPDQGDHLPPLQLCYQVHLGQLGHHRYLLGSKGSQKELGVKIKMIHVLRVNGVGQLSLCSIAWLLMCHRLPSVLFQAWLMSTVALFSLLWTTHPAFSSAHSPALLAAGTRKITFMYGTLSH